MGNSGLPGRKAPPAKQASTSDVGHVVEELSRHTDRFRKLTSSFRGEAGTELRAPPELDVAIVIALAEEFEAISELVPANRTRQHIRGMGCLDFLFERKSAGNVSHCCVATVINEMGEVEAALVTQQLLRRWKPRLIVNIGISGSTNKDVKLGDVVVATHVERYLADSKSVRGKTAREIAFELSGKPYDSPTARSFTSCLAGHDKAVVEGWQAEAKADFENISTKGLKRTRRAILGLVRDNLLRPSPRVWYGPIASGPGVAGSRAFIAMLKRHNRKFQAIDMESGGFMAALRRHVAPPRDLVIRGVSDFADERKTTLDESTDDKVRAFAMRNAVRTLWRSLDAGLLDEM